MTEIPKTSTKIQFVQYHQPSLKTGEYQIEVSQKIADKPNKIPANTIFTTELKKFSVAGERFTLNPQDIQAVFPPAGSLGEHSNVLPHIILNRSTLPWERTINASINPSINGSINNITWLALLLFDEDEKPNPQIITLKQLQETEKSKFPKFTLEDGQHEEDKVTVIDLKKSQLQKILPTLQDLKYLAHVRQGTDTSNVLVGDEFAVIICNRLPNPKGTSVVHLVSLENRYITINNQEQFDFKSAGDNNDIRLVSLKSWSFACVETKHTFNGLLTHLNQNPSTLRLSDQSLAENAQKSQIKDHLKMGYVPLRHYLRQGGKTISWYRSPLATGNMNKDIEMLIRSPDQLVCYNPENGMFDVSYAAAWELGRLLGLQNQQFSVSLYRWKRSQIQQLKQQEISSKLNCDFGHLPINIQRVTVNTQLQSSSQMPNDISSWLNDLSLLKGVPFNYLVPDERLLPVESIRFFCIDRFWINCLLDGAFSIGRVKESDFQIQLQCCSNFISNLPKVMTGFLLRSEVVSGWPGLEVDGMKTIDTPSSKLKMLRMEQLSANVLMCLFAEKIEEVQISQKPETIHFGFDSKEGKFSKTLRNSNGTLNSNWNINDIIGSYSDPSTRVIKIEKLADHMKTKSVFNKSFTSAQFALQLIEGIKIVKFTQQ